MMAKKFNSASRILHFFLRAKQVQTQTSRGQPKLGYDGWAETFQIDEPDVFDRRKYVYECLVALRDEIKLLEAGMIAAELEEEAYINTIGWANQTINPDQLLGHWGSVIAHISELLISEIRHKVHIMPSEDGVINEVDIDNVISQLKEIEQEVLAGSFSNEIKQVLLKQIRIIISALRSYRISGKKSFYRCQAELMAAVLEDPDIFDKIAQDHEADQLLHSIVQHWQWYVSSLNIVANIPSLADGSLKIYKAITGDNSSPGVGTNDPRLFWLSRGSP